MGTNFYWSVPEAKLPNGEQMPIDRDDPVVHIGKRSAAGRYCWDCDVTLQIGGKDEIHMGRAGQLDACPNCGRVVDEHDPFSHGPVAVELGFAEPEHARPTGVGFCSSFSWAQDPERVGTICRQRADEPLIEDEYGRVMTCGEFLVMLEANCPVQFTHSIGRYFS